MTAPFLNVMSLLHPSYLGLASRALNPRPEPSSAAKKQKLLPRKISVVTFHYRWCKFTKWSKLTGIVCLVIEGAGLNDFYDNRSII